MKGLCLRCRASSDQISKSSRVPIIGAGILRSGAVDDSIDLLWSQGGQLNDLHGLPRLTKTLQHTRQSPLRNDGKEGAVCRLPDHEEGMYKQITMAETQGGLFRNELAPCLQRFACGLFLPAALIPSANQKEQQTVRTRCS